MAVLAVAFTSSALFGAEYHVSPSGEDTNDGSRARPLRTISAAGRLAQPGDVITVHEGVYRERVAPPRGGRSDTERIVYQAAPGEKVEIKGSEVIQDWAKVQGDTWKVTLPNSFFGSFNPYSDLIQGDWYKSKRPNHTGAVYVDGHWLLEAVALDDVLKPVDKTPLWFAQVDDSTTTIWAQFPGINPNDTDVEINVRKTVFSPEKTGINYITVRGFVLRHAATNWAPPTAGQIGLVSAYWCKGWIIENNDIGYSTCSGIALGKYSDEWDNRAESAAGYVGTLTRALQNGWNKATVGSHTVRNNHIHHCEQAGIVGSLGCSFSTITGNVIHDIHVRDLFSGAEMAGIKLHGAIDVVISRNHIHHCGDTAGIWLDWMAQGAQITGNLLHNNSAQDIFCEMQHGPLVIANNLLLSRGNFSFWINAQGIAFAHNLVTRPFLITPYDGRGTPYLRAHSTELAGESDAPGGDHRFYNNVFIAPCSLDIVDGSKLPCFADGNVFLMGSKSSKLDAGALVKPDFDPGLRLQERADGWYLTIAMDKAWRGEVRRNLVTTDLLGKAKIPDLPYVNADDSRLRIDTDYFGKKRNEANPFPGPFEIAEDGRQTFKVWPIDD